MWLSLVMVVVVVAALVGVLLLRPGMTTTNSSAGGTTASSQWQTYHDPLGLFTLRLPPGWTAQVGASPIQGNSRTGSVMTGEEVSFHDPSQGTGSARIFILAFSIKTDADRQSYCQGNPVRQDFSPLTLTRMEHTGALAIFVTENAHFQIDVTIPGVLAPLSDVPLSPPPTATPIPATWVTADKTGVNTALVSFQPTDPKPLTC